MPCSHRIGGGAFGNVYKVSCPTSCPLCWSTSESAYVVKRIPRENFDRDLPAFVNVFNEVTCLELLAGLPGVSRISNFGIDGSDYCIIMECGGSNLADWRSQVHFLMGYICNFHVLSHLLLIYICKLHWNLCHSACRLSFAELCGQRAEENKAQRRFSTTASDFLRDFINHRLHSLCWLRSFRY